MIEFYKNKDSNKKNLEKLNVHQKINSVLLTKTNLTNNIKILLNNNINLRLILFINNLKNKLQKYKINKLFKAEIILNLEIINKLLKSIKSFNQKYPINKNKKWGLFRLIFKS